MKKFLIMRAMFILLTFLKAQTSIASLIEHFNRSPKGLLMGDAFTAIADDEYTLFYNPAALGRHQGLSLWLINPDASITNILSDNEERFKNFPKSDPSAIANRLLGFPLHLHLGATPGLKMGNFGFSFLVNDSTNAMIRNAIHPSLDLDYRLDRGFVLGYAYTIGNAGKNPSKKLKPGRKKSGGGVQTSFGVSVKNINREGLFKNFDIFGLELLEKISATSKDFSKIKKSLGYSYGNAWGGDFGIEHTIATSSSRLNIGLSFLDVGDTRFIRSEGTHKIPRQKMSVNSGVSWNQDFTLLDYTLSFDMAPLNQGYPIGRLLHFGAELGLPIVSLFAGWNGGYISYGLGINLWLVKFYAGFYSVELGQNFLDIKGQRGLVYLSILDFSFDSY